MKKARVIARTLTIFDFRYFLLASWSKSSGQKRTYGGFIRLIPLDSTRRRESRQYSSTLLILRAAGRISHEENRLWNRRPVLYGRVKRCLRIMGGNRHREFREPRVTRPIISAGKMKYYTCGFRDNSRSIPSRRRIYNYAVKDEGGGGEEEGMIMSRTVDTVPSFPNINNNNNKRR